MYNRVRITSQRLFKSLNALTFLMLYLSANQGTARVMCNSFASSLWMLPFSKHCHVDHRMSSNFRESDSVVVPHLVCDKKEYERNSSSWPVNLVKIDLPATPGNTGYVCFEDSKVGH